MALRWRKRPVPFVEQVAATDCGLACVAMVAGYHGRPTTLEELRTRVTLTPGAGIDAQSMLELARQLGLRGRVVAADFGDLDGLPTGTVLHWDLAHFVVLEHRGSGSLQVMDPSSGRVRLADAEVRRGFSGVALLLEPGEGFATRAAPSSGVGLLVRELLRGNAWVPMVTVSLLLQMLAFGLPALTGLVVERVVPLGDRGLWSLLWLLCAGAGGLYLLAQVVRSRLSTWLVLKAGADLRVAMMDRLLGARMRFYFERSPQDLADTLTSAENLMRSVSGAMLNGLIDGLLAVTFLVLLSVADASMAGVVVLLIAVEAVVLVAGHRTLMEREAEALFHTRRQSVMAAEALFGVESVKALGLERRALTLIMNQQTEALRANSAARNLGATLDALHGTLRYVGPLVVLLVGTGRVLDGSISLGQLFSLAALAGATLTPVVELTLSYAVLPRLQAVLARVVDVMRAPQEAGAGQASISLTGAVRLEKVTFRYGPTSPPAVSEATLHIEPGEFIGIVGASGSGKSTLASLLVGLVVPDSGRVEFDGRDLQALDLFSVRSQIGFVPQRPYLFTQTVRDNITTGDPSISLEAAMEAARLATIHEEISRLAFGYETVVSNFAVFSGGQRQRLSLARALVRNPKILILDEATSAVDTLTEQTIQRNIEQLRATRVVIAHRLSTVRNAHRLVLMDAGAIVDVGTWSELLARQPQFRALAEAGAPAREEPPQPV